MPEREAIVERERRWLLPAGIASVAGVALVLASMGQAAIDPAEGIAAGLRQTEEDSNSLVIGSCLLAFGWILLGAPLLLLFSAARARAPQMRSGLKLIVFVAPIFLAAASILAIVTTIDAASDFSDSQKAVDRACSRLYEERYLSEASTRGACLNETAEEYLNTSSARGLQVGLTLAGLLGLTVALVYTSLWALRTGLLSRFWGSFGIAVGAIFAISFGSELTVLGFVWFIYLGLLLAGWVPGGRPPAWGSGEARPWPKGGPLFGGGANRDGDGSGDGVIDGEAEEVEVEEVVETGELTEGPGDSDRGEAPRKRKKRDP